MNKYAQTALIAAKQVKTGMSPEAAWEKASCEIFEQGSPSQRKGCPKNAFLGLYGVNVQSKNAQYAINALRYLRTCTSTKITPGELWQIILPGEYKAHNSQMDVVLVLYREALIQ